MWRGARDHGLFLVELWSRLRLSHSVVGVTPISINADAGESVGLHSFGMDNAVMDSVDWVNVACAWHAGDPDTMDQTVREASARGLKIGAHPGLPDIVGFGRREMKLTAAEVESLILFQVGALAAFLKRHDVALHHLKPHGALYGMLARDAELMRAAAGVAALYGVPMLGMAGTAHEQVCEEMDIPFVAELYVDLDYRADGSLIIVRRPTPKDPQVAARRVRSAMAGDGVEAIDGTRLDIQFQSICIHSDIPGAPDMARAVRDVLESK